MIAGSVHVPCPGCGIAHRVSLVQSINPRTDPDAYRRLLDGTLNVLACECGVRAPLAVRLVFHDPDREYWAQTGIPLDEARIAFAAAGATGTLRVVPSQNALVEKLQILEADLEDWAIEMTKVLLLASETDELDTVLLFHGVADGTIQWIRHTPDGPIAVASAFAAYERIAARAASRPRTDELQIDRAWAFTAVQAMLAAGN